MLMMFDMIIKNTHLATPDACTHITHSVVVTDVGMLIIWICITRLSSVPHHFVSIFCIATNESTSTRGCNHFITIERENTILTKGSKYLPIEA